MSAVTPRQPAVRVLLVEDEEHLAFALRFNLEAEGYAVAHATTPAHARERLKGGGFAVVVLDVMLPDGSGVDFCRAMRGRGDRTPVLMLTAKNTPADVVVGLGSGADDYLGKPFDLAELLARLAGMLRRQAWESAAAEEAFAFGPHEVDFANHRVRAGGESVEPTELELRLLRYFVERADQVVGREDILQDVWGVSPKLQTRTVDNFVVRLRRWFERDPSKPRYFTTVRGVGYRFSPNAEESGEPSSNPED